MTPMTPKLRGAVEVFADTLVATAGRILESDDLDDVAQGLELISGLGFVLSGIFRAKSEPSVQHLAFLDQIGASYREMSRWALGVLQEREAAR